MSAVSYIFEGDSTTAWNTGTESSWQQDLTNYSTFPASTMTNGAVGGSTTATMWGRYTNSIQKWAGPGAYLTLRIGINDILTQIDWQTSLSNWNCEVSAASRDGFKIINYLCQWDKALALDPGSYPTEINNVTNLNNEMLTNPLVWLTINIAAANLTNYASTIYFDSIGLHPTALEDTLVASNFNYLFNQKFNTPVIVLGQPALTNNQVLLNFTVSGGLVSRFHLLQTTQLIAANWTTNEAAALTTNIASGSYRFTATNNSPIRFYRVQTP
jgi:hypothetical protein